MRGNPADLKEQNKSQPDHHRTSNVNVLRNDKNIEPKILIEPLMREYINKESEELLVYCFSGKPLYILRLLSGQSEKTTLYDDKLNIIDDVFSIGDINIKQPADNLIKQSIVLSKKLCTPFNFVRIDWMVYKNKIYFEELTFTPYSGFHGKINPEFNNKFGELIKLERLNNEL